MTLSTFSSLKDQVVYNQDPDAICGDERDGCRHELVLDFYGSDYLVDRLHDGRVSVHKFPRGVAASIAFDECHIDHIDSALSGEYVEGVWWKYPTEEGAWPSDVSQR